MNLGFGIAGENICPITAQYVLLSHPACWRQRAAKLKVDGKLWRIQRIARVGTTKTGSLPHGVSEVCSGGKGTSVVLCLCCRTTLELAAFGAECSQWRSGCLYGDMILWLLIPTATTHVCSG